MAKRGDSQSVQIFEVGPRDGLQNEPELVSLEDKISFVSSLARAGIQNLEMGAFVRPDRVPQMADTDRLYQSSIPELNRVQTWCLVPNRQGLKRALSVGATRIAVFTAATETFVQKNIGMTIRESIQEFRQVIQEARSQVGKKLKVRGYVSTAFGCPFEGPVAAQQSLKVIHKLVELGVDQISIGDTIGVATPGDVEKLIRPAIREWGPKMIAGHFHDTRGTALANALKSIELGVRILDSSAGGLGGCPFAPGASGNLATEDLVYMLDGMKIKTGVDLESLCEASLALSQRMKKPFRSRYLQAYISSCQKERIPFGKNFNR